MTLQEWFYVNKGKEDIIAKDDELRDAIEAYTLAHEELSHILNQRGFVISEGGE